MLIELSTPSEEKYRVFWDKTEKRKAVYSISETELKKAIVMFSIGIECPRVHVSKVKAKIPGTLDTMFLPGKGGLVCLYKDDSGFYLEKVKWD